MPAQREVARAAVRPHPAPAPLIYTFVGRSQTRPGQLKGEPAGKLLLSPAAPENDQDLRRDGTGAVRGDSRSATGGWKWSAGDSVSNRASDVITRVTEIAEVHLGYWR